MLLERGDDLLVDRASFDPVAGRSHTDRFVVRGGRVRKLRFSLRLPTVPEAEEWLRAAGFAEVDAFDERGEPFGPDARRLILRAFRPGQGRTA
jgi:hypothetical protein